MRIESIVPARKVNRLRRLWGEGGCAFGAIATIPSVLIVQVMAHSGLDWILIDMAHGLIDIGAAHAMIAAAAGTPLVPLVRMSGVSRSLAVLPLDYGAMGICLPQTNQRADAEALVRAVRYSPEGERSRGCGYPAIPAKCSSQEYQDRVNDEVLAIGTIDDIRSIGVIDEILSTRGLDMVFIDEENLAATMRPLVRSEDAAAHGAILKLEKAIHASPVALAGTAGCAEQAKAMVDRGYRALAIGHDWSLLQHGVNAAMSQICAGSRVQRRA
jgi:4-hydroxy-2-oxoheptanedioate aldolase